jgi:hypothetical protein
MRAPADHSTAPPVARPPFRFDGFRAGLIGRDLNVASISLALLLGFGFLLAGLEVVRADILWGFSYDGAVAGIMSQLAVTGPAAVLMAVATTANVLAGAIVLRFFGTQPFRSVSELVLAGFTTAVILDAAALFVLASVGLFGWPELLVLHAAVFGAYAAVRLAWHRPMPLMAVPLRIRTSRPAAWWPLVLAVWAGPLIIQLASPAVPFMDVLPNHVAPVEHIRVFGSFSTLTTSPSPIYGPSRLMLGYVALLGQLTTITNLDAVLAEAAFALPLTVLIAVSIRRLTGELFGGSSSFWVLLTFPLTFTFMRIPDSRGTVVVFPLALWALATVAAELRYRSRGADRAANPEPESRRPDVGLMFALGGSFLVHPIVGLVAMAAAGGALVCYPTRLARRLVPALVAGLILAVPQVLTMGAIDAPSWIGAICIVAAVVVDFGLAYAFGAVADRARAETASRLAVDDSVDEAAEAAKLATASPPDELAASDDTSDEPQGAMAFLFRDIEWTRPVLVAFAIVFLLIEASWLIAQPDDPASEVMIDFPHLVWLALAGAALSLGRFGRGWVLLGCGLAAGLAAWTASGFVGSAGLTEQAVHYEVPKTIEYWLPVMLAIGGAAALAALCRQRRLGMLRSLVIVGFLFLATYPIESPLATNVQIGEHREAESLGLALREAQLGYWNILGYKDSRHIIDAPTQAVVDELRAEEEAGRLGPETRVLNIAWDFQQWDSVPIGVFTGALETSISLYPELSIHTVGGRLLGFDQLDQQLAAGYGYVVVEPPGLGSDLLTTTEDQVVAAGYHEIWENSQAIIYARD